MSAAQTAKPGKLLRALGPFAVAMALLSGCASPPPKAPLPLPSPECRLAPGDLVEVRFVYTPDMNLTQAVRADGKITLDIIGDVEVTGLTPAALTAKLRRLYVNELKQPVITVILRTQYARRVYVGGEVGNPGMIPMPGRMTLLEAVMQVQGVKPATAEVSNVLVVRHVGGQRRVQSFDLRRALGMKDADAGEAAPQLVLHPGDIIYVPETRIVKLGRWVDQHINKIIPDTDVFVTATTGTTTIGFASD